MWDVMGSSETVDRMKLSDFAKVRDLICKLEGLKNLQGSLGRFNPNSRYATFSAGYYNDSRVVIDIVADGSVNQEVLGSERANRIIKDMIQSAQGSVGIEIEKVREELETLGVDTVEAKEEPK